MKLNKNKLKGLCGLEKKKSNLLSSLVTVLVVFNIVQYFICRQNT